jgi:hypothetical protein
VSIAGQKRIVNGYYGQLEDDLQILFAFSYLALEIFGIIPILCKTVYYFSQGGFTL